MLSMQGLHLHWTQIIIPFFADICPSLAYKITLRHSLYFISTLFSLLTTFVSCSLSPMGVVWLGLILFAFMIKLAWSAFEYIQQMQSADDIFSTKKYYDKAYYMHVRANQAWYSMWLDCIDSWSLHPYLLCLLSMKHQVWLKNNNNMLKICHLLQSGLIMMNCHKSISYNLFSTHKK